MGRLAGCGEWAACSPCVPREFRQFLFSRACGRRRRTMTQALSKELESHPFVADFDAKHRDRLGALARKVHFDAGQVIFREGDEYSVLYLLKNGMVALEL